MRCYVICLALVMTGALVAAPAPFAKKRADLESDFAKFQGRWESENTNNPGVVIVAGHRIIWAEGTAKQYELWYRLFPDHAPKAIDLIRKDDVYRAIYMIRGDTLTIYSSALPHEDRPLDFNGKSFFDKREVLRKIKATNARR